MPKITTFDHGWGFRIGDVLQFRHSPSSPQYFCSDRSVCKVIKIYLEEWDYYGAEARAFVTFRHASGYITTHLTWLVFPHVEPANPLTTLVVFGENR